MRIAELSRHAGVPVATVKWYLLIGLLPKGTQTARNQADYTERHLHRLRFVRSIVDVGGLSIEQAKSVVTALDDPDRSIRDVVTVAHAAVSGSAQRLDADAALPAVDRYLRYRGLTVDDASPARSDLAAVVTALRLLELGSGPENANPSVASDAAIAELLDPYAEAIEPLVQQEIDSLPSASRPEELAERIIVGTVLMEQAIGALRRLTQESAFVSRSE
jgi:DNA-binding transcriptional MerR regulator